jgi:hypothetical protein
MLKNATNFYLNREIYFDQRKFYILYYVYINSTRGLGGMAPADPPGSAPDYIHDLLGTAKAISSSLPIVSIITSHILNFTL